MRYPRLAVIVFCLTAGISFAADQTTGVAFVHGTGRQTDAYTRYWQPPFVNKIIAGLPRSYQFVVINCDFERYWWEDEAAGCLADQIATFISSYEIEDLYIITHSNGGNVMRWVMSNPVFDERYALIVEKTRKVVALAPSSAGTPLADAVWDGSALEQFIGWIFGYRSDAVAQQRTADMAYYNAEWLYGTADRPELPKPFWSVVGTDVSSNPFSESGLCGGLALNIGLEFTQWWLDSCSDGFLNCTSQEAAGMVWFRDTQRTIRNRHLSHNQSRRDCFGLPEILRGDL